MEKKTNYNWMRNSGLGDFDDMDVVNSLGLDPKHAYSPSINKAALDAAKTRSLQEHIRLGYSKDEAQKLTDFYMDDAISQIKSAEERTGKKFL